MDPGWRVAGGFELSTPAASRGGEIAFLWRFYRCNAHEQRNSNITAAFIRYPHVIKLSSRRLNFVGGAHII